MGCRDHKRTLHPNMRWKSVHWLSPEVTYDQNACNSRETPFPTTQYLFFTVDLTEWVELELFQQGPLEGTLVSDRVSQITQILDGLQREEHGSRATEKLLPLVYEELRAMAAKQMAGESPGLTIQSTALVHEVYLRLIGGNDNHWDSRGHFFAAAAEAMRRILIERARKYKRQKHGGNHQRVDLDVAGFGETADDDTDILALDDALKKFESEDPVRSEVVKLRYFAGLTIEQTASILEMSPATVKRHWTFARAWLCDAMGTDSENE